MRWPFGKRAPLPETVAPAPEPAAPARKRKKAARGYAAANTGRLFSGWGTSSNAADVDIYRALGILRARSRDLALNDPYAKRFLNLSKMNIVGPRGIALQVKSRDEDGNLDKEANRLIEAHWKIFCKMENCTVTGQSSMIDVLELVVISLIRDGEILIRFISPWPENPYFFALQLIEADQLDTHFNGTLPNGNRVVMGVEKNKWGRPVAYHLLEKHPGDSLDATYQRYNRIRIPAEEMIHFFIPERVNQSRGVPWLVPSAARCKMLDGYEEAELVASRTAAATMGWFVNSDSYVEEEEDEDEETETTFEAEPGTFRMAPDGYDLKTFDPTHPNSSFAEFSKSILRGIAAGWNVSYHSLANDLENINLSSIRHGEMVDRDGWKIFHTKVIEHIKDPVYSRWLAMFLTTGITPLPPRKYDKFNAAVWMPRGWHRVDPEKESRANTRDIANHTKSIVQAAVEKGLDLEEIFQDNAKAKELAAEYGLELTIFNGEQKNAKTNGGTDQTED